MKIKTIAALCKRSKQLTIFQEDGMQFAANGYAAYPLDGMPELEPEEMLTVFDIPEKDRENWRAEKAPFPTTISLEDIHITEQPAERAQIGLKFDGKDYVLFYSRGTLLIIRDMYLLPLADEMEEIDFRTRIAFDGKQYIVAKKGMFLRAAIMPVVFGIESAERLIDELSKALSALGSENIEDIDMDAQMSVDPDTGEVTE